MNDLEETSWWCVERAPGKTPGLGAREGGGGKAQAPGIQDKDFALRSCIDLGLRENPYETPLQDE